MTEVVVLLILAALAFLGGMAIGILVQESGTRRREREIAAQRRDLADRVGELRARNRDVAAALPRPRRPLVIDQTGDIVERV